MIETYFDFRLFRLWKTRQHSKLHDYDELLWCVWLCLAESLLWRGSSLWCFLKPFWWWWHFLPWLRGRGGEGGVFKETRTANWRSELQLACCPLSSADGMERREEKERERETGRRTNGGVDRKRDSLKVLFPPRLYIHFYSQLQAYIVAEWGRQGEREERR